MGSRADFYVGRGKEAQWHGSTAWDGYPEGVQPTDEANKIVHVPWPEGQHLFDATTEAEYLTRLAQYFTHRDDVTHPEQGWPWPWKDSTATDYAYAFFDNRVWASCFGRTWFDPHDPPDEHGPKEVEFPDMSAHANVTLGSRSGLIFGIQR